MPESKSVDAAEAPKQETMFRNAGNRIFYLKPRAGEKKDFLFGPGMTIKPMDADEELLLATISMDIRDVAKEAPIVGGVISDLQQKVAEERKMNHDLKAANADLQAQLAKLQKTPEPVLVPAGRGRKKK